MMTAINHTEKWPAVTRREPCAICKKPDFCVVSPDGAIGGCMRQKGPDSFKTAHTANGEMYLYRLTDEPREAPEPRPQPTAPTRDIMADRAVFGIVARSCAALPPIARAELARRFGAVYGPRAAERFGIGYADGPAILAALAAAGRTGAAQDAGILWRDGSVARSFEGKLVIPHRRDGLIHDLRIGGIKGIHEETREISLPGGYAEREIADLFLNHDALGALGPEGVIHLGGGSWKTIALVLAGLENTVGTRGEAELSPGHIDALHAAGVRTIIHHIDAEDAKDGQALSAGRRLGLAKAERLAAAGFAVLIAEPPREPGTPKVDPDALLRDLGPRAVRDYALSAIPLDAWRVVIGVAAPGVPEDVAARLGHLEQERRKANRTLSSVIQIRRNGAIKTERDTLTASVLHMRAEQANKRATPAGRIRQPLYVVAQAVGKTTPIASDHLRLGPENDLFDREVLKEVIIREVDPTTGESRKTLRLINERKEIVEECPAEAVFGTTGAPSDQQGDSAYYVTPRHEPEVILERLVFLDPVKTKKNGGIKEQWGGKRCPRCGSTKTRTVTYCGDCDLILKETIKVGDEKVGDGPEPITAADLDAERVPDEPAAAAPSIPPTPIAVPPTPASYPPSQPVYAREEEAEEGDDWDPYECNACGCRRRLDPALHKRYCWEHRHLGLARAAPPRTPPPPEESWEPPAEYDGDDFAAGGA